MLSPLGVRQAQIVGQHLVDLGLRFDRCLSGDLSRQQDTARHALQQFSVAGLATPALEVDPAFNEFDAFGGLNRLLDHAQASQHTIAVFTSGGTITALLHLLTRIPASEAFKLTWHIANTSLSRLSFQGREVTLASFNSHLHLQLLKTPSLITYR